MIVDKVDHSNETKGRGQLTEKSNGIYSYKCRENNEEMK
jgi:hypothetical protein